MSDSRRNFAYSTVATAPSPATSGTSLVVASGDGTKFPAVPFNATVWPTASQPTTANAEIVRVTAISTDTLTITRAQEASSARTVVVGDQIAATVTAKTLLDAEREKPLSSWIPQTGLIETCYRRETSATPAVTSGTLHLVALQSPLKAGVTYTSITFFNGGTSYAAGTSPHLWYTLVNKADLKTLRSTSDETSITWALHTAHKRDLSSTYTPTVDTDAYVGIMVAQTGGTMPNPRAAQAIRAEFLAEAPIICATSNTGATTPLADGTTISALATVTVNYYWACVS